MSPKAASAVEAIVNQGGPASNHVTANNQYKIKKFIDEIYQKEMKYRYHKQYVREDYLLTKSPIFDLQKYHALKPRRDLVKSKKTNIQGIPEEENEDDYMKEDQSLTNILGF